MRILCSTHSTRKLLLGLEKEIDSSHAETRLEIDLDSKKRMERDEVLIIKTLILIKADRLNGDDRSKERKRGSDDQRR